MPKQQKLHICHNGKMLAADKAVFTVQNRAFRYGDALFESICVAGAKIPLLNEHLERLLAGANALKYLWPKELTAGGLEKRIHQLLKENKLENARLRFTLYRTEGGFYLPEKNEAEYVIEAYPLVNEPFEFNKNGLVVDIYSEMEKHFNLFSQYKTANGLLYILASVYRKEHNLNDCLLLNSRSRVIESITSNLFLVKHNEVYTPPLAEGCVAGVMRAYIINHILPALKIPLHEQPITLEELFEADEAFLSNAIYGLRWIGQYKIKHYGSTISHKISNQIRKQLLS